MTENHPTGTIPVEDGALPYTLVLPGGGQGPGIVLCYEIFGRSEHMIGRAERLASLGYVVMLPDYFWRLGPDQVIDEREENAVPRAMGMAMRLDRAAAAADGAVALDALREREEVVGGVGVLGYCMGGMLAYLIAVRAEPDAAVLYYPSGVEGFLGQIDEIHCPTLYEFGADDDYLPADIADRVRLATADQEGVEVKVQPEAGHAFDNELSPLGRPPAAAAAWRDAQAFLRRWLPTGA